MKTIDFIITVTFLFLVMLFCAVNNTELIKNDLFVWTMFSFELLTVAGIIKQIRNNFKTK